MEPLNLITLSGDLFNLKKINVGEARWTETQRTWVLAPALLFNGLEALDKLLNIWDWVSSSEKKKGGITLIVLSSSHTYYLKWMKYVWKRLWHHQYYINVRCHRCIEIHLSPWDNATTHPSTHGIRKQPFWSHLRQKLKIQVSSKANSHVCTYYLYANKKNWKYHPYCNGPIHIFLVTWYISYIIQASILKKPKTCIRT